MEPLLELRDIHYAYHSTGGETQALSNISFSVNDGEFIAIVGPSGCGNPMVQPWKHFSGSRRYFSFFRYHWLPQTKIWAFSPSQTTLSSIILRYSLFSMTDKVLNIF